MRFLTPSDVDALLSAHGLRASKALGQHFLADPNTARRIVRLAGVQPGDRVLEIGPGIGSLTVALAEAGAEVVAVERDRHVVPVLEEVLGDSPAVTIVEGDALTIDFESLLDRASAPAAEGWIMVSNLPYNVATPVVVRCLEEVPSLERLVFMVQREVAERLVAPPGTRAAGAVSVKVAYHASARVMGRVPPTVFVPRPNVESAVVRLHRRPRPPVAVPDEERFFTIVRAGFAQRRKTLGRALRGVLGRRAPDIVSSAGIDPRARAEALELEQWAALARVDAEQPADARGAPGG